MSTITIRGHITHGHTRATIIIEQPKSSAIENTRSLSIKLLTLTFVPIRC